MSELDECADCARLGAPCGRHTTFTGPMGADAGMPTLSDIRREIEGEKAAVPKRGQYWDGYQGGLDVALLCIDRLERMAKAGAVRTSAADDPIP